MQVANVNDAGSVEKLYSKADFETDARLNAQDKAVVHHGLKILTAPDANGDFTLIRANQHVGEEHAPVHSVFVSPFLEASEYGRFIQDGTDYGGPVEPASPPRDPADPYRSFIEDVLLAARSTHFPPALAAERLKAFLGG